MNRIGFSKDIHRLSLGRSLIICGVHVPYELGCIAHSDGDVVYHAVSESILGALSLGDLGSHFPDNDPSTEGMDSKIIVNYVIDLMKNKGFSINNIDIFISLEKPKLKDYIPEMKKNLSTLLNLNEEAISIKAGTNEKCDAVGKGEAIEAYSIVLLEK